MAEENKYPESSGKWTVTDAVKVDLQRAIIGGCVSGLVIMAGSWLVGFASNSEALQLFKTTLPNTRAFCGTLSLALGNILALMLTLLSLSASMDVDIKWTHYERVRQISWIVAVTLIATVLLYLLLNIPISESEEGRSGVFNYNYFYYALLVIVSVLGGSFVTIVLLLYNTVRDMIGVMDPNAKHSMRDTSDGDESKNK